MRTNHIWKTNNAFNVYVDGKQYTYSIYRYGEYFAEKLAQLSLMHNRKFWDYFTMENKTIVFHVATHKYGIKDVYIDNTDFDLISQYKISISKDNHAHTFYAKTKNGSVHKLIMNPLSGMVVDHINKNGLDNRKENLRVVTVSINNRNSNLRIDNSSSVRGVSKFKNRYRVFWYDNNKIKHSKSFSILKYGELEAFNLAVKCRQEQELKYNYIPLKRSTTIPKGSTV
jgi:hypothetical protein